MMSLMRILQASSKIIIFIIIYLLGLTTRLSNVTSFILNSHRIIKYINLLSEQMCDQDISCVFEGVAGMGAIYISNLTAAQNTKLLNGKLYS